MKKTLRSLLCLLVVSLFAAGASAFAAAAERVERASSVVITNGSNSVFTDYAEYTKDGYIELGLAASNGYGTRANFSALGERAKIDVKNFTTTVSADTPIGIATVISLQTAETGTIGGGNGNGMHVLLRKDGETTLTLAVYNQNASRTYFARENALEIANDKTVRIEFDYDGGAINVASGNSSVTVENLKEGFDEHYSQYDYKGYYTLSCYYMAAVKSNACVYTVKEINGKTPAEVDGEVVSAVLADLKAAVDALGESSSYEDIESAAALDVFTEGVWGEVASAVANEAFITQKREVDEKLSIFIGKLEYGRKTDAIAEFAEALEGYSSKSAEEKKSVKAAYEKIFSLSEEHTTVEQKTAAADILSSARAKAEYPAFINGYAEGFVSSYENSVKDGEAEDLSAYLAISDIEDIWREFKAVNALDKLSAAQLEGFDGRVEKLKTSASNSFYSDLWREGESWQAKLTENGLYVTGEGAYGETLGYNKKLELGKTTEIKFNVIYALRKLGANHLHIGFYPVPGTGTMGTSDGVRVDFWFSGTVIEVKPVNGRTELPVYDAAYISVADTGFFDPELPDPDQGAYTVKLGANGSTLFISVNGLEMDLTGLDANLYKNGCYLTVSAMSVKGADRNELVITSVGDISFVPANGGSDGTDDQSSNKKKGCKGALGGETFIALACFVALKRRKNYFVKGE